MNIQTSCSAKDVFRVTDPWWPGSVHDSSILKRFELYRLINEFPADAISHGDVGHGFRPQRNPQPREERVYNNLQSKNVPFLTGALASSNKCFQHCITE